MPQTTSFTVPMALGRDIREFAKANGLSNTDALRRMLLIAMASDTEQVLSRQPDVECMACEIDAGTNYGLVIYFGPKRHRVTLSFESAAHVAKNLHMIASIGGGYMNHGRLRVSRKGSGVVIQGVTDDSKLFRHTMNIQKTIDSAMEIEEWVLAGTRERTEDEADMLLAEGAEAEATKASN